MKVIALDISTRCGVAIGVSGATPTAYSLDLGKPPHARRFSRALELTSDLITEHKPDLIAYEMPVGGREASSYLIGLAACVEGVAFNRGVRVEAVASSTARKHFIGKALSARHFPALSKARAKLAIKGVVQDRCRALGWPHDDLDGCDALAIWDFACATWGRAQSAPLGGLF